MTAGVVNSTAITGPKSCCAARIGIQFPCPKHPAGANGTPRGNCPELVRELLKSCLRTLAGRGCLCVGSMEHQIDLTTGPGCPHCHYCRQQAVIEKLEKRIAHGRWGQVQRLRTDARPEAQSRGQIGPVATQGASPGLCPHPHDAHPAGGHALEECPDCGTQLSGGWTQRTREVIELPRVPAQVTEHVYIARTCARCQRRCVASATAGRGAGPAASGDQPGQPDCRPTPGCPGAPSSGT